MTCVQGLCRYNKSVRFETLERVEVDFFVDV